MGVASFLMSPRWGSSGVGDRDGYEMYGPGHPDARLVFDRWRIRAANRS
jgi:hypothetical protein